MKRNIASLAKITRPSLTGIYPRERLFSLLDKGRENSVMWITGPPGSGKTTLLSNYLDNRNVDYLWYQVDQGDTDIATFFYYTGLAALKDATKTGSTHPSLEFGETISQHATYYIQNLLRKFETLAGQVSNNLPGADKSDKKLQKALPRFLPEYFGDLETFTKSYFRELFIKLNTPFVVVFDNYDTVPAHSEFHEVIRYALSEVPINGCVIFISRSEPPAAMAIYRASQNMQIISWDDLRLTRPETDGIVKSIGLNLSKETLTQLYDKTQGWAAGVVLMLEYFRTEGFVSETPETFTPHIIFDYLAGEIFQKFDKETKEFLLSTACLPKMTIAMAEEISGKKTSADILNELNRHHYFVTAKQTPEKIIYQYHPLFRDFLLTISKQAQKHKENVERLRIAALLLESNDQTEDAVELLLNIRDYDLVEEIIQNHALVMIESGRRETLSQWLEDLPKEKMENNPWLVYWLASCRFPFALRECRRLYEQAYKLFMKLESRDVKGLHLACAGVIDAILYELDDLALLDPWVDILKQLLQKKHEVITGDTEARVITSLFMAMLLRQPDDPDIENWVERAHTASHESANPRIRQAVEPLVAVAYMWDGYFSKAHEIIESLYKLASTTEMSPLEWITLKNFESMFYMLIADRDRSLKAMNEGLEIAHNSGVLFWNYQLLVNGLGAALGNGDLDTAEQIISQIQLGELKGRRQEQCLYYYFYAWFSMLSGDKLEAFQHQKKALRLSIEIGNPFFEIICRIAMAQLLFEHGDERKGTIYLKIAHEMGRNIKNHSLGYLSFLSYSYIAMEHGRKRSALSTLQYAMQVGREYGYKHALWWQPDIMSRLCEFALQSDIETVYVRNLISERQLVPLPSSVAVEEWPWLFKIYTLGQCRILKNEQSFSLVKKLQRKPVELLKALIAHGGTNVNEEILATSLWPGVDSEYSYRSLTTTIHRLRKILGEDRAIIVQDSKLSLNQQYFWVDLWAFDNTISEIDQIFVSETSIDTDILLKSTERLKHLYRGHFMADEPDKPWYEDPREEIKNKYLRCMSKIARYWEDKGNWEKAIDCYERVLEVERLTESFYRRLMHCYRKLKRNEDAIEVYLRCKKIFTSVLKSEPSAETMALYDELMHEL